MRKTLIALGAAVGALSFTASPAMAQYGYSKPAAYGNPSHYNYGRHGNGINDSLVLLTRADQVSWRIRDLDRRNKISRRDAYRLQRELSEIRERLHYRARNGISLGEYRSTERQIARVERKLWKESRDYRHDRRWDRGDRYDRDDRYDRNGYRFPDRDRDGRDDRYEDDGGTQHDYRRRR